MRNSPEHDRFIRTLERLRELKNEAADAGRWTVAGAVAFEYRGVIDGTTAPEGYAEAVARAEALAAL